MRYNVCCVNAIKHGVRGSSKKQKCMNRIFDDEENGIPDHHSAASSSFTCSSFTLVSSTAALSSSSFSSFESASSSVLAAVEVFFGERSASDELAVCVGGDGIGNCFLAGGSSEYEVNFKSCFQNEKIDFSTPNILKIIQVVYSNFPHHQMRKNALLASWLASA